LFFIRRGQSEDETKVRIQQEVMIPQLSAWYHIDK
jgi:hypothetical protein